MIAKISKGAGFNGCLQYNLNELKGHMLDTNMNVSSEGSVSALAHEFRSFSNLNERCKKPVLHIPISFSQKDKLSDEQMKEVALKFLERFEMKMNGGVKAEGTRPYVIVRHTDTQHQHLHIITSRVDSYGKVLKDNNDFKEANNICRQLEKEMGLEIVSSLQKTGKKSIDLKEINMEKRRKEENTSFLTPRKELIAKINDSAKGIGGGKQTFSGFVNELKKRGVEIYLNTSADHSRINGISYSLKHDDQNRIFKGSTLGKNFTWDKVKNNIDFNPARDKNIVSLLTNKERFSEVKLTENDIKLIRNDFKINLEKFESTFNKRPIFNFNYRFNNIAFTEKRALYLKKLNAEWREGNYKNDPIKYFESIYKSDRQSKYLSSISEMKSLSKDEKNKVFNESISIKKELNSHLEIFMKRQGFEYSKDINERIKPLIFTKNDNEELQHLNQKWRQNDYNISPMDYLYERVQVHQSDYRENLLKSLKRLDDKYGKEGLFSNKEVTDSMLKLADKTNFNHEVPKAVSKLDKTILSSMSHTELEQFNSEKVINFVTNEISSGTKSISPVATKSEDEGTYSKLNTIEDMFKGIGSGPSGGQSNDDENYRKRKRKRKPKVD